MNPMQSTHASDSAEVRLCAPALDALLLIRKAPNTDFTPFTPDGGSKAQGVVGQHVSTDGGRKV